MNTLSRGVRKFNVQNLVAVLRAIPESNGTYADVARIAQGHGGDVRSHTIANWVQAGKADMRNGNNTTAYARFTRTYRELIDEHCGSEINRTRELDRALEIIARTCECGNEKVVLADGTVAEQCRLCYELDKAPRHGRRRTSPSLVPPT